MYKGPEMSIPANESFDQTYRCCGDSLCNNYECDDEPFLHFDNSEYNYPININLEHTLNGNQPNFNREDSFCLCPKCLLQAELETNRLADENYGLAYGSWEKDINSLSETSSSLSEDAASNDKFSTLRNHNEEFQGYGSSCNELYFRCSNFNLQADQPIECLNPRFYTSNGNERKELVKTLLESQPPPIHRTTKMKPTTRAQLDKKCILPANPLQPSLFSELPPTLVFFKANEEVVPLPPEIRRLLIWKLSTITPIIIRQTVTRSGYQLTRKSSDWVALWGKHMKSCEFQTLKDTQKVNHFPGSHNLGRKDNLLRHIRRSRALRGESEYNFIPETYILPKDIRLLRKAWEKRMGTVSQLWIVKPPASARGTGIHLINKWNQVPKKQASIVQKYIANPYLINGSKFDLRIYVLVSSFNPLRIYIFENGLVRFASVKYSNSLSNLDNMFMHLTNYTINKNSSSYTANNSENACDGHKWTLKALWGYLARRNVNVEKLWNTIEDIVIKTIICAENGFNPLISANVNSRYTCFELFGFDIMFDSNLRPWLLEVNISPSLHSSSHLDTAVKGQLVVDMLNIVGFHVPDKISPSLQVALLQKLGISNKTRRLCLNRSFYSNILSREEKEKHELFEQNKLNLSSILDDLLPDDIRHLMQGEDELSRCGKFLRIFPSTSTPANYYHLMRVRRYYNILQMAWEIKYSDFRRAGITRLQTLALKGIHLQGPKKSSIGKEEEAVSPENTSVAEILCTEKKPNRLCKVVFKIPSKIKFSNLQVLVVSPSKRLTKMRRCCSNKD